MLQVLNHFYLKNDQLYKENSILYHIIVIIPQNIIRIGIICFMMHIKSYMIHI